MTFPTRSAAEKVSRGWRKIIIGSSGTLWDEDQEVCDYEDNVDCGDRPYPGGSTSRTSTMTPTTTRRTSTDSSSGPGTTQEEVTSSTARDGTPGD